MIPALLAFVMLIPAQVLCVLPMRHQLKPGWKKTVSKQRVIIMRPSQAKYCLGTFAPNRLPVPPDKTSAIFMPMLPAFYT